MSTAHALEVVDEALAAAPLDSDTSWEPVDLGPYLNGTYSPPRPRYGLRSDGVPLIYPGMVHSIAGESEGGKTWLALLVVAERLLAGDAALFVDLEDGPASFTERLLLLGVPVDVITDRMRYLRPSGPLTLAAREHLAAAADGAAVAVIDAVTEAMSLHGLRPKDDVDVAAFLDLLPRWIAARGPAVLQLDHVVKDTESRGRWATGSQHKLSGLDGSAFVVEPVHRFGRGMHGRSRVLLAKDRHGAVRPHQVSTKGGRDWIADLVVDAREPAAVFAELVAPVEREGDFRPTYLMHKVSDALVKADRPLTGREVLDRVTGSRQQTVRQALAALVDEGFVEVEPGPQRRQLHKLIRPFTEETK